MKPDFILRHLSAQSEAEPMDAIKFLYQSAFGCGHLLADESVCAGAVETEISQTQPEPDAPVYEPLGGGLCRLNLRAPQVRALPPIRIARMMQTTAKRFQDSSRRFSESIDQLRLLAARYGADVTQSAASPRLPFTAQALEAALADYTAKGSPYPRHSERYRRAYGPAYRVVLQRYASALPLITLLETRLREDRRATLALDGDCASGKTSLIELLAPLYNCNVFHMDDFFLPLSLRTPQRLAQPGGNVHYERFLSQVLTGLLSGEPFDYDTYSCHTGETRSVRVVPRPVSLVEGSYSLHPAFEDAYQKLHAIRALLTVTPDEQVARIRLRNGEALLQRFQNEWIPLEIRYFQAYHKTRGDELILPSDWQIGNEPVNPIPQGGNEA
ncbi:MAG: hypothetical protein PHY64_07810 [Eubacteriales bacterium]|nr:hypothetical protein [Eubacteriales bacterium]